MRFQKLQYFHPADFRQPQIQQENVFILRWIIGAPEEIQNLLTIGESTDVILQSGPPQIFANQSEMPILILRYQKNGVLIHSRPLSNKRFLNFLLPKT